MNYFRASGDEMFDASLRLSSLNTATSRIAERSLEIAREMKSSDQSYSEVSEAVQSSGSEIMMQADCIRALSRGLLSVAENYVLTEKQVAK